MVAPGLLHHIMWQALLYLFHLRDARSLNDLLEHTTVNGRAGTVLGTVSLSITLQESFSQASLQDKNCLGCLLEFFRPHPLSQIF